MMKKIWVLLIIQHDMIILHRYKLNISKMKCYVCYDEWSASCQFKECMINLWLIIALLLLWMPYHAFCDILEVTVEQHNSLWINLYFADKFRRGTYGQALWLLKRLEATHLMGERWKEASSHHAFITVAPEDAEGGRIIAARGRVSLQDLFSLMLPGLTINLNHHMWEGFVHICLHAGWSGISVTIYCVSQRHGMKDGMPCEDEEG